VVAVSVDGLNPTALTELGAAELPTFWRLIREGASTFDARTEVERTDTLPNHTGMLTGRRVDADHGGHGVLFNDSVAGTIEDQTGVRSASVFDVVADAGLTSSLFASKYKFEVYDRSWPSITEFYANPDNEQMTKEAVADLTAHDRSFAFVHLSAPDVAGHAHTWLSPQYLDAVKETDANLGRLVDAIEHDDDLADDTVLLVTADHGGNPHVGLHTVPDDPDNYTIPFLAWGAGVPRGADLYALNPGLHDPGDSRPGYGPGGPIRNGDVANAALDLLGLSTVPGSELGVDDPVQVR
jgi:predicted AlkP superfamily pyrophosphatase or phosphodiesterase